MELSITRLISVFVACSSLWGQSGSAVFRSDVRLVEVYATVFDHKGNYLDGLDVHSFSVLDEGKPRPIVTFESEQADISCAILLDTTGSMLRALPSVKNAVLRLIDVLRDRDAAAIYAFSASLDKLQDFTTDKKALRSAVLRTRASGSTALFDAIAETTQQIGQRKGKKVMIVFTDGDDNASMLNVSAALSRVKKLGIPVYTIAEGEAVASPGLESGLKEISQLTGGLSYTVRKPKDVETVFTDISEDLKHGYLITYRAPASQGFGWRRIQVVIGEPKNSRVRSREGYLPQ